jgi:hypothetical protein
MELHCQHNWNCKTQTKSEQNRHHAKNTALPWFVQLPSLRAVVPLQTLKNTLHDTKKVLRLPRFLHMHLSKVRGSSLNKGEWRNLLLWKGVGSISRLLIRSRGFWHPFCLRRSCSGLIIQRHEKTGHSKTYRSD